MCPMSHALPCPTDTFYLAHGRVYIKARARRDTIFVQVLRDIRKKGLQPMQIDVHMMIVD